MRPIAILALVLLGVSACAGQSILQVASRRSDLSTVVAAINAANFTELLSDPNLVATALLPNNRAFAALLRQYDLTLEDVVSNVPTLQTILLYHVIPGAAARSGDLTTRFERYTTALPESSLLTNWVLGKRTPSGYNVFFRGVFSRARVVAKNIRAGRGIIHVIDNVLLPIDLTRPGEPASLYQALGENDLTALAGAVAMSSAIKDAALNPRTNVTVFAPTNDALTTTLASLPPTLNITAQLVDSLLSYHIVGTPIPSSALQQGDNTVPTLLNGAPITVVVNATGVFVRGAVNTVQVVATDVAVRGSIVHVINGVLIPPGLL